MTPLRGKLARAKGPTFEAEGELAAQRRHSSFVITTATRECPLERSTTAP
jgi:hypothetical protein